MSDKKPAKQDKLKATLIDGIAASEHLDSSGERIEIRGIDISSLTTDGVLNFEHKSAEASQIVGKITKAKKIFERKDCENDRQKYFWDKIKTPYLYIVGELFDAVGHQGAKDVAAMLRYDETNKDKKETDETRKLINFSIEGQKLEKRGSLIKKCIARKVSITLTPCNKVCEAEELKDTKDMEKSEKFNVIQDMRVLTKGEKISSCQLLHTADTFEQAVDKGHKIMKSQIGMKLPKIKTGRDIYGPPPKLNDKGRALAPQTPPTPATPKAADPRPTPAQGSTGLTPTAAPSSEHSKFADYGQKYAQTNRRYGTITDRPKKKLLKNNMRKAIIASVGTGAPSTKVNDLSREDLGSKLEPTCEPKIDLKKPSHKMDNKKIKKQTKKDKEHGQHMGKSEAKDILIFVQGRYPQMSKTEQVALAKTVAVLRKKKKNK